MLLGECKRNPCLSRIQGLYPPIPPSFFLLDKEYVPVGISKFLPTLQWLSWTTPLWRAQNQRHQPSSVSFVLSRGHSVLPIAPMRMPRLWPWGFSDHWVLCALFSTSLCFCSLTVVYFLITRAAASPKGRKGKNIPFFLPRLLPL